MKRLLFLLFLFGFLTIPSHAQSTKTIQLNFTEEDFTFEKVSDGYEINSSKHIVYHDTDTLKPDLPYILINVLLDNDTEYDGFNISVDERLIKDDFLLNASKPGAPNSANSETSVSSFSYPALVYPDRTIEFTGIHLTRGYKHVSFKVFPFKYDATIKKLYIYNAITLNIKQKKSSNLFSTRTNIAQTDKNYTAINNIVINKQYAPDIRKTITEYPQGYEYLIITSSTFKPIFQRLADWKNAKGIRTLILTTEEVDQQYNGATQPIRIKKAIKDLYEVQHQHLEYVLLGGDVNIVPTQMCYVAYYGQGEDTTPTDWFYGCLDTIEWDTNSDGVVGGYDDNIDLTAEVIVSRLSANTYDEAKLMVDRIINYEGGPSISNWEDKILLCGKFLHEKKYSGLPNGWVSDAQFDGETIYYNLIYPNWDGSMVRLFDTGTDFPGDSLYDFNIEHFQAELSKGYTFVNVDTHGSSNTLQMEIEKGWPSYSNTNAIALSNPGYTFLITSACTTNAFDQTTGNSLSEAFVRNPYGGILSYIGSSREG